VGRRADRGPGRGRADTRGDLVGRADAGLTALLAGSRSGSVAWIAIAFPIEEHDLAAFGKTLGDTCAFSGSGKTFVQERR
jgi:hypothetical protein